MTHQTVGQDLTHLVTRNVNMNNMKYGKKRVINLGRYGFDYETIAIEVSECESQEEADREIAHWEMDIREKAKQRLLNSRPARRKE